MKIRTIIIFALLLGNGPATFAGGVHRGGGSRPPLTWGDVVGAIHNENRRHEREMQRKAENPLVPAPNPQVRMPWDANPDWRPRTPAPVTTPATSTTPNVSWEPLENGYIIIKVDEKPIGFVRSTEAAAKITKKLMGE